MNYILFDPVHRDNLLPLVFTRPVADIRIGITTIREKWESYLAQATSSLTPDYLQKKYPTIKAKENTLINGSVLPSAEIIKLISKLKKGQAIYFNEMLVAACVDEEPIEQVINGSVELEVILPDFSITFIENSWDIFSKNGDVLKADFSRLTNGRKSQKVSSTNFILGDPDLIFIEEGATVEFVFLNTHAGPIYIGKDSTVMEGAKIRGPFALGEHSTVKLDAKIYEGTTIGPHCKVGGEVQNTVFFGYSNKGHDGYLGNAVIGEWCNFGADTNNSNLKNTYDIVRIWSYSQQRFVKTGLQFCGLIMGDHSKTGINTMFNTGTVVGVSCNLFGAGYQRNFIPSFSWGGPQAMTKFNQKKVYEVTEAVFERRGLAFDETEKELLTYLYQNS